MDIKRLKYIEKNDSWEENWTKYNEYLNLLSAKDKKNKLKNTRYNTFLVFHSGKVIMSGLTSKFMKDTYYYFISIMKKCYDLIAERLEN